MSRSSPDRLSLHLGQQGWRLETATEALRGTWPHPPLADELPDLLAAIALPPSARKLAVTLEHYWARCQLVRLPKSLRAADERRAFVQTIFRDIQGINPETWQITTDSIMPDEGTLSAAIENDTLTALKNFADKRHLRITSIQPAFYAMWNALHRSTETPHGAIAWYADGRAMLGLWQNGSWLALRSQPIAQDDDQSLGSTLQLLLASSAYSSEGGTLFLCGEHPPQAPTLPEGWQSKALSISGVGGQP